jgi:heme exporter protein B
VSIEESRPVNAAWIILKRDLLLAFRHRSELINPLLFFAIVVSLFPLSLEPDPAILATIGAGVIWVAALLATLLSLDFVFRADFEDGTLEQMLLSPAPTAALVGAKVLAHWLIAGLPLIIMAPLLGVMMNLPGPAISALLATLSIGTPVLSLIGAIGAALTVALRRSGVLLSLLVLPLYIPVMIFGASAVGDAAAGLPISAPLWFIGALLVLALTLAPLAIAAALRISLE